MKLGNHISCKKTSSGKNTYQQGILVYHIIVPSILYQKRTKMLKTDPRIMSLTKHANISIPSSEKIKPFDAPTNKKNTKCFLIICDVVDY